jgi:predicted HD phosphohydrolase
VCTREELSRELSAGNRFVRRMVDDSIILYARHLGVDPDQRERYRGQPHFDRTAEFCALYDEISFDPDYRSEPMASFEPMVRRVLDKRWWTPPS